MASNAAVRDTTGTPADEQPGILERAKDALGLGATHPETGAGTTSSGFGTTGSPMTGTTTTDQHAAPGLLDRAKNALGVGEATPGPVGTAMPGQPAQTHMGAQAVPDASSQRTTGTAGLPAGEQPGILERAKDALGLGATHPETGGHTSTSGVGTTSSPMTGTNTTDEAPGLLGRAKNALGVGAPTTEGPNFGSRDLRVSAPPPSGSSPAAGMAGDAPGLTSAGSSRQGVGLTSSSTAASTLSQSQSAERGMSGLLSSDDHWAKAQAATEEARRQAKLVEKGARSHREAYEEYYKAERLEIKTKHTVEEIETRIRGFNVDAKRAQAAAARAAYDANRQEHERIIAAAEKAHRDAEAMQSDVNAKGKELHAMVAASKMHADRLSHLEAELVELRSSEQEAHSRHLDHVNNLEPLKAKHAHHKSERARMAQQLSQLRAQLDELHAMESKAQRTLDMHQNDFDSLDAELAEGDALAKEKEAALNLRTQELEKTLGEQARMKQLLGEHRQMVGTMTKETQQAMDIAHEKAAAAERQAAELQKTEQMAAGKHSTLEASREALSAATAEQEELRRAQRGAAQDVESYAVRASKIQAEMVEAKKRLDLAEAKKEELWEVSKREGALADAATDVHYTEYVAKPAGEDPMPMTHKTDLTADLAGRTKIGSNLAIDHQASTALPSAGSVRQ